VHIGAVEPPAFLQPLRFHTALTEGWRRIDFITREYAGLVGYYLRGRTSALFPAPLAQP